MSREAGRSILYSRRQGAPATSIIQAAVGATAVTDVPLTGAKTPIPQVLTLRTFYFFVTLLVVMILDDGGVTS